MAFQQRLSGAGTPSSIQTPWDSITPWWAAMENQSRGYRRTCGEAMYGRWEPQRQAICHDEEVPFHVPPLGPSMSYCIPFKPRCVLLQTQASWPAQHLTHSSALALWLLYDCMTVLPRPSMVGLALVWVLGPWRQFNTEVIEGKSAPGPQKPWWHFVGLAPWHDLFRNSTEVENW